MAAATFWLALGMLVMGTKTTKAITVDTVTVGDAGNLSDSTGQGAVSYDYNIGITEVNIYQYTAFLNAVAASDPFGLYNPAMATDANIRGITRSGLSGSFTYSVMGSGYRPVTYVSWFDAARFANWMANGQPTGAQENTTTENGAYSLFGATSGVGFTKNAINPNTGTATTWWIPSEDEWYKAAYYDPSASGPVGDYWLFPTRSDDVPGNFIGPQPNHANHRSWATGLYSVTGEPNYSPSDNYLSDGGAFTGSASYYGTFDQGGNVGEWTDTAFGSAREVRGGNWAFDELPMQSDFSMLRDPTFENSELGFRLATVPEPSVVLLLVMAGAAHGLKRRQRSRE